ncbi:ThuA domain-containing protein [Streptomyces sp. NPDC052415]|uniref:ThuA domain-containing protein n=1 Tax=Streptomyces sp. NPDC052415 TaxID=3365690 RepID=UPI0037D1EADC
MRSTVCLATVVAGTSLLSGCVSGPPPSSGEPSGERVLVFSKTAGFRHGSIPAGVAAVKELGATAGLTVDATEDAAAFTHDNLRRYATVVFLSTTGDVLDDAQQRALERHVRRGGGFLGIHAAADTEYDWPFYGGLVGAYFRSHPAIRSATVDIEDHAHPSTSHLPTAWNRTDEWYDYRSNPRAQVHVLASLDESSYSGGAMNGDHPIAWCHTRQGGRVFYTGGGHTEESYADPAFRRHLLGGLRWTTGAAQADCRPENGYRSLFDGTKSSLSGWRQAGPGSFTPGADGSITSTGGMGLLWYARQDFHAYSLKLDWKAEGDDNSGVFGGFPPSDDPLSAVANGYEIQIDATDVPERTTGSVYGFRSADPARRDRALNPPGEWNTYEIRVEGERLRLWLNGEQINDFTSTDPARSLRDGHIGIQNHGSGDRVSFRNVRIKELPARIKELPVRIKKLPVQGD